MSLLIWLFLLIRFMVRELRGTGEFRDLTLVVFAGMIVASEFFVWVMIGAIYLLWRYA